MYQETSAKEGFWIFGTGPGTQAFQLAKRGFDVTATDLSENAIAMAKKQSNKVNFVTDDFLNSKLPDDEFDYIFDRGCFHVFDRSQRPKYVEQIKRILKNNGKLFLKCMSVDEKNLPDDEMPHKFSKQNIIDIFGNDFEIQSIKDSVFQGTLDQFPKALFFVMKKKSE